MLDGGATHREITLVIVMDMTQAEFGRFGSMILNKGDGIISEAFINDILATDSSYNLSFRFVKTLRYVAMRTNHSSICSLISIVLSCLYLQNKGIYF